VSDNTEKMDSKTIDRLDKLLDYVHHVGKLNQKPIFRIEEYKQLNIWEHELKGKIGIQHNITGDDGISIWLRIERLKRLAPPPMPEQIQEWVAVGNDPESSPQIKEKLIGRLRKESTVFTGVEDRRNVENDIVRSRLNLSISPEEAIEKYIKRQDSAFVRKHQQEIFKTAISLLKEEE